MDAGEATFRSFVEREYTPLVRGLSLFCGDRWIAEELAQDALARAFERWDRVVAMRRPAAWVHTVAFNLARSRFRRRAAERRAHARHGPDPDTVEPPGTADAVALRTAVLALSPRQREVLIHRYFLGRSVAETADVVGIGESAVKVATHRAIASLRARFDVALDEHEGAEHA